MKSKNSVSSSLRHDELGITTLAELEAAAYEGGARANPGDEPAGVHAGRSRRKTDAMLAAASLTPAPRLSIRLPRPLWIGVTAVQCFPLSAAMPPPTIAMRRVVVRCVFMICPYFAMRIVRTSLWHSTQLMVMFKYASVEPSNRFSLAALRSLSTSARKSTASSA